MQNNTFFLNSFTVSLFGHRQLEITPDLDRKLSEIVKKLILEKDYVEFLIGRDGDFDIWAASIIKGIQKNIRSDNSSLTWVMPYLQAAYTSNASFMEDYYSNIEVCENSAHSHYKQAFTVRNRCMVERSDLVIVYLSHSGGGVSQAVKYAEKQGKPVINLYDSL